MYFKCTTFFTREIILIYWFGAQETIFIIFIVENIAA